MFRILLHKIYVPFIYKIRRISQTTKKSKNTAKKSTPQRQKKIKKHKTLKNIKEKEKTIQKIKEKIKI